MINGAGKDLVFDWKKGVTVTPGHKRNIDRGESKYLDSFFDSSRYIYK